MSNNRVNVDLSINTQAYEQNLDKTTKATKAYETETRKISDATVSFNKELRAAKKAAFDLAGGYAQLSKEAKNSDFGKEMKRQLDEAMQKAADYVDLQSDLREEMKNLASDTKTFDQLSAGLDIFMQSASAASGIWATFTGREEDARRAITMFTTAQSTLNAVTKIQTALQKQSNLMLAIGNIQKKAAAAATKLQTSTTIGATVAQAAFNKVANMNPYVLLATGALAVVGAIGTYIAATSKQITEEEKQRAELKKQNTEWKTKQETVNDSVASVLASYKSLQQEWNRLKTSHEKNEFLDKNKSKFSAMGFEIDNVNELEELFTRNTSAVVNALKARAEAEAWGKLYQEQLEKKIKNDLNGSVDNNRYYKRAKAGDIISDDEAKALGIKNKMYKQISTSAGTYNQVVSRQITAEEAERVNIYRNNKALKEQQKETSMLSKIEEGWANSSKRAAEAQSQLNTSLTTSNKKDNKGGGNNDKANEIKAEIGSIEALEAEISRLQSLAKKGALPPELQDPDVYAAKIKSLSEQLKGLKIKWGFEKPQTLKQRLEQQLSDAEYKYQIAVEGNDADAIAAARDIYIAAYTELEKHKLQLNVEKPVSDEDRRKVVNEINSIVTEALTPDNDIKWDFSDLPEEMKAAADKAMQEYNKIKDAHDELNRKMQESQDDLTISQAQQGLEKLAPALNAATTEMQKYQAAADQRKADKEQAKEMDKRNQALGSYIDMINSTSNALNVLGDSEAAQMAQFALNTTATIANAIKTIAAMQAEALASGTASGAKLPFPANVAAIATIVGAIASIFASLPKFAHGGVVGGNSTVGDKLLARVNSKETILTEKQASNALDMMDSKAGVVNVVGKIRGTDIILVSQNVGKAMKKSGKNITFG